MKRTRIVKTPERTVIRPPREKRIQEIFCDICEKKVDTSLDNRYCSGGHKCEICGRDICRKESCFIWEDDPNDYNGSIRICIVCHPIRYKKYLTKYYDMKNAQDKLEEDYFRMIREESLEKDPIN